MVLPCQERRIRTKLRRTSDLEPEPALGAVAENDGCSFEADHRPNSMGPTAGFLFVAL